jgi:hypothetical protein
MRVPMFIILSSTAIALSGCGQINTTSRSTTVSGVASSSDYTNYVPVSSGSTNTGTGNTGTGNSSPVSGATSSSAPTISSAVDNGSSNTLGIGSNITFEAPFQADATLTYQWYKNGSIISGATSAEYSLSSIQSTDYAAYTVKASNSMGSLTSAAFVVNPVLMLATLGSHDCNGSQCWNDATTADKVCKIRYGSQSVIYNPYAYGPAAMKWTTQFCTWNGSDWNCQSNCTWNCSAYNVLGYVYCFK